ncbi:MAG: hypothetical protein QM652_04785, partial [Legionella sp.]|uniref:hypothetical protein n=1 Tax=Legionella sp. TaxID=459 RepID=UPI0039E57705
MNTKKTAFKPKKIPYYASLAFLTIGASLILGFLSFGGMYAIAPLWPLAIAVFVLSVAYEGEIYLQNIKGSLDKNLKFNYLKNLLARDFLLKHFPRNTNDQERHQFFEDYERQLKLLAKFGHRKLDDASEERRKQAETKLKDMEKWFARQLLEDHNDEESTKYAKKLRKWLAQEEFAQDKWRATLTRRRRVFYLASAFSSLSALFMGLGTTYLIMEAFSVLPFMAAIPFTFWPLIITPMAVIAGAAYGLLIYNTLTDMVNHDTLKKWYRSFTQELSLRNLLLGTMSLALVTLALGLTICTAGTWWTITKNTRPLFYWMAKMPNYVMGVINPIVTGFATFFFTIQNTANTIDLLAKVLTKVITSLKKGWNYLRTHGITQSVKEGWHHFGEHGFIKSLTNGWAHLRATENWGQILNPVRIVIKLTITPLRVLLFLGHLVSIAFTADRMPGLSQITAALIALISEGFEDAHYFMGHSHHHDDHAEKHHHHHDDHAKEHHHHHDDHAKEHHHHHDDHAKEH